MQMRTLYYSVDKRKRAGEMRRDALECARAGFPTLAECLYESAELLCPSPREEDKDAHRVGKGYRSGKSESDNGVVARGDRESVSSRNNEVPGAGGRNSGAVARGSTSKVAVPRNAGLAAHNGRLPRSAAVSALASGRAPNPGDRRRGATAHTSPLAGAHR